MTKDYNRIEMRIMKEMQKEKQMEDKEKKLLAEGWIKNNGVKPAWNDDVEVMFNNGEIRTSHPKMFAWYRDSKSRWDYHIEYYRPVVEEYSEEKRFRDEIPELMGKVYGGSEAVRDAIKEKVDFHGDFKNMDEAQQDAIINPKHYQLIPPGAYDKFPDGLEYMDVMQFMLAHHKGVEAHLLGQIFKYAIRLGKKDDDLQDAKKIQWYADYLVNVIKERS